MTDEITIVIADDHPIVRQGLRQTIEEDERLRVVAEVSNGREAVEAVATHSPRVTILDVDMPLMNGFERPVRSEEWVVDRDHLSHHTPR
jgi:two-component system nitrate/nitrite response regulator NarL